MTAGVAANVELWAPQIADLLAAVGDDAFIAGGAARQLLMRDEAPAAEDIDLFLRRRESFDAVCAAVQGLGYRRERDNTFSVTFGARDFAFELPVQVIKPYRDDWSLTFGTPVAVIDRFSFTTEMFAVTAAGAAFEGQTAREDTLARRLLLQNITNPLWVSLRAMKYAAKGYYIAPGEMRRVLDAWMDRPQQRRGR